MMVLALTWQPYLYTNGWMSSVEGVRYSQALGMLPEPCHNNVSWVAVIDYIFERRKLFIAITKEADAFSSVSINH